MKKGTKKALTVAALASLGAASWMMYKKKNPNMMDDMKRKVRDLAMDTAYKLEEME